MRFLGQIGRSGLGKYHGQWGHIVLGCPDQALEKVTVEYRQDTRYTGDVLQLARTI
jgi:hypothetical protein